MKAGKIRYCAPVLLAAVLLAVLTGVACEKSEPAPDVKAPQTSETVKADALPEAVSATLNAKYPGAEIKKIETEKEGDAVEYEITILHDGKALEVDILDNGTFVEAEAAGDDDEDEEGHDGEDEDEKDDN